MAAAAEPAPAERQFVPEAEHQVLVDAAWLRTMAVIAVSEPTCDVVFVVGGERLPALRHLCAGHSEPLGMLFGDGWGDKSHGGDVVRA